MVQFTCKFYVSEILKSSNFRGVNIALRPVLNDDTNKSFSKYTPGGEVRLTICNDDLVDKFEVNQEFLINFEEFIPTQEIDLNNAA